MRKKDAQKEQKAPAAEQKNALVIHSEEVRDYWRGMCFSDYPAAESAEGGAERAETMLKATALIMARNIQVTNHKNGLFLFFFDSVGGSLPTDEEITDAIQQRDTQTYYYTEQEKVEAEKRNLDLFMEYTKALALDADILPYIRAELRDMAAAPAYAGENMAEYLFSGELMENNFIGVIAAARQRQERDAQSFQVTQARKLDYPVDKPNNNIWHYWESNTVDGQLKLWFDTNTARPELDTIVTYHAYFDALPEAHLSKQLTPYDKRVYIAAAALYNAGNTVVSMRQIFRAMGNKTEPNAKQLQLISDSLTKMMFTRIVIDNTREAAAYGKGEEYCFKFDGALLHMNRITKTKINGAFVDGAIRILEEPALVAFARQRKQITTIKRELLESPISKTEGNLAIDDYLIENIGQMKNEKSKRNNRILYDTICSICKLTGRMQKLRLRDKVKIYLTHYQSCGFIKGFTEQADGVTIVL